MPIKFGERENNWDLFYENIVSPFANKYKDYVHHEKKRRISVLDEQLMVQREKELRRKYPALFKSKRYYQRAKQASLSRTEEANFIELLQRIGNLGNNKYQREALLLNPMTSSSLAQIRFLFKYKTKIMCFINEKANKNKELMDTFPPGIRNAINDYWKRTAKIIHKGVRAINPKYNFHRAKSLPVKENDQLLDLVKVDEELNIQNNDPIRSPRKEKGVLILRGKSCYCQVYIYIYIYLIYKDIYI